MGVSEDKWKWHGTAAHFIGSASCLHHVCTRVGKYVISTVGDYRPNGPNSDAERIGCDRKFETFVFKALRGECACGCGLPNFRASEIDSLAANDHKTANANHMKMCRKWAKKP